MTGAADLERLLQDVQQMDRPDLIALLKAIPCPFPIDFSDTYLSEVPLDRLKHLVLAVCLHVRRAPPTASTTPTDPTDPTAASPIDLAPAPAESRVA